MRKKITKKWLKRIAALSGALVMGAVSLTPNVMGGNISDTPWSFSYATSGSGYASPGRYKLDDSSVYIKCKKATLTSGSGSTSSLYFKATAYGSYNIDGTYSNITYNGKKSPTYSIGVGKVKYMTNYINEAGRNCARIYYQSGNGGHVKFSGVWSPDSV